MGGPQTAFGGLTTGDPLPPPRLRAPQPTPTGYHEEQATWGASGRQEICLASVDGGNGECTALI